MGQKVNPIGFRLAVNKNWLSRWFASKRDYADYLLADCRIRQALKAKLAAAAVSRIMIERAWNSLRVTIYTARPGAVIGRGGKEIDTLTKEVSDLAGNKQVKIDIVEIKRPELDAQLVAENVAAQLERRISFRRAMKRAVQTTMDSGALGIKIRCAGRLGGAEIARAEWYREGTIPLHTLRIPIDYGFAEANTVAGKIGVKCWICRPEGYDETNPASIQPRRQSRPAPPPAAALPDEEPATA